MVPGTGATEMQLAKMVDGNWNELKEPAQHPVDIMYLN